MGLPSLWISAISTPAILVVEDEPLLLEVIAEELEEAGFAVLRAQHAEAALALLGGRQVDLLFTDIRLPGRMDGWELAEQARALKPGLRVIYSTGYTATAARPVAGSQLFHKPYRPAALLAAMHVMLG